MDTFNLIMETLMGILPHSKKERIESTAKELTNYHTDKTLHKHLQNYFKAKTSRRFKARMLKAGIWYHDDQPIELAFEVEQVSKNIRALPQNCIEKLINEIKLRLLLDLHPNISREDLRTQAEQVDVTRDLERLKQMIQAENSFTNAIFKHFKDASKAVGAKLLYEVKEIEKKLYHLNILQLKELTHEAADARKCVEGRDLILLLTAAKGLSEGLLKGEAKANPEIKVELPEVTLESKYSQSSSSSSEALLPSPCLHALPLPDQEGVVVGSLPSIEESSNVEAQLSQKYVLEAVTSAKKVVLLVPVQKKLEETVGKDYLMGLATKVSHLVKNFESQKGSVQFVFEGYDEVEELRKRVKAILELNPSDPNTVSVLKHILSVTSADATVPCLHSKDFTGDIGREALLGSLAPMAGIDPACLGFVLSRAAEKAAVDYCSHLFSLCFLHLNNSSLVKYMAKNVEFVHQTVPNEKIHSISTNLQAEMKTRLRRRIIVGIDCTYSISPEFMALIKKSLEEVFTRIQETLKQLNLTEDHFEVKIIAYSNYSSGRENLSKESNFTSKLEELNSFVKGIQPCGKVGNEAIEVLYQAAVEESQLDMLVIVAAQAANTATETHLLREQKGKAYWKNSKYEEEVDAELECRLLMSRGIPINCVYVGDEENIAKDYFENITRESGGRTYQFKKDNEKAMTEELFKMLASVL